MIRRLLDWFASNPPSIGWLLMGFYTLGVLSVGAVLGIVIAIGAEWAGWGEQMATEWREVHERMHELEATMDAMQRPVEGRASE